MQRELVRDILALAAPASILKGYAQCWVDLVQATQPARQSLEAENLTQVIVQHSCSTRLSFLIGAAAAPTLSQGILGVPSAKLAGRVLMTCTDYFSEASYEQIVALLTGMLSAAPGATMAVAQQDDTREEVRLSQEAKMLGWGAVMLHTRTGARTEADTWFEWIYHTHNWFSLDVTVLAMSLTRAMFDHPVSMPEVTDLLARFLLRQDNANNDDLLNFNNKKTFESLLVGALLGADIKIVKKDT